MASEIFGIAAVLLVVAWFAGILTVRPKGEKGSKWKNNPKNPYKKSVDLPTEEDEPEVEMEIDDISFDENFLSSFLYTFSQLPSNSSMSPLRTINSALS